MRLAARALIAVVALACLGGCAKEETEQAEVLRPVRYEVVYASGGNRARTFSGTAQAGEESQLSFKVAGNVQQLAVSVGDRVDRGALIAVLDDNDYRLRVQEAEAALTQATAQLRNAEASYQRVQALWENANASKQDLDGALAAFDSAKAQVASMQKRLELARLQVEYCRLTAPYKGAVASVAVELNENISSGRPVAVLTSAGPAEVRVAVPEVLIAQIRTGSAATATFAALGDREFAATVTEVGVTSTGFATTYPVTVRIDDAAAEIRPGMASQVTFPLSGAQDQIAILVPAVAVGEDAQGRHVFVIEPAGDGVGVARRRAVQVGELDTAGLEILSGLQEGELVVTAGVSRITDGQRVKLD